VNYLSVCSGIEAASYAWHPLGWNAVAFSEIEPFPSAVLAHHYPSVPNWGDMTKFKDWPDADVDVLVGGTPCQSFSVAGLRAGLDDPRGNLMLVFGAIADRYRPRWLVWENVPGVLSSNGGRDFGSFLGLLGLIGYGFAYRVLDAQYFGLAQRRKRVFVVGCLGDWRRAAAVLFERSSLSGHPAPSREARETTSARAAVSVDGGCAVVGKRATLEAFGGNNQSGPIDVSTACNAHGGTGRLDFESETFLLVAHAFDARQADVLQYGDMSGPLDTNGYTIAFAWQAGGGSTSSGAFSNDLSPTLPKNQTMAVAFQSNANDGIGLDISPTIRTGTGGKHGNPPAVAFDVYNQSETGNIAHTLRVSTDNGLQSTPHVSAGMQVRRLTPRECERLQGFPDDYTLVPYRGKPVADGPRYKALGNSFAVPVVSWIGRRIDMVEAIAA